MNKLCCVCKKNTDSENSAILVMGGFGNPKFLCSECSEDFDKATGATDFDTIKAAIEKIGENLSKNNISDDTVLDTIEGIFAESIDRAEKIKAGTYDFSMDKEQSDQSDDIPEELMESEEDKLLDQREAKTNKKIDGILNWVFVAIFVLAIGYFVYRLLS